MKIIKLLSLLILMFSSTHHFAQEQISEVEKLEATSKVWGFLKYYHPKVSKGKFDWDQQLIDKIPGILDAKNQIEFNQIILSWIQDLGKIKNANTSQEEKLYEFNSNFDLKWLYQTEIFSEEVSHALENIRFNRNKKKKYYVAQHRSTGNIEVKNEKVHFDSQLPPYHYRLVDLFRYWNIVEYFFPYKYQMDKPWDETLKVFIPRFKEVQSFEEYKLMFRELITYLNDSHALFYDYCGTDCFGKYWVPFQFQRVDNSIIINSFYNEKLADINDLQIGDIILAVNGININKEIDYKLKYVSASNLKGKYKNLNSFLFNGDTDQLNLTILRDSVAMEKTIKRYSFSEFDYDSKPTQKWKILEGNIGYANLINVKNTEVNEMMSDFSKTRAVVFDLRNGVFDLWGGIGKYLKEERSPFLKILKPDLSYPGNFEFTETKNCCKEIDNTYKGKVVLLVNENTQSHGEFTAMAFQSGDSVITVGSQTAGADGNISILPLVTGNKTAMSGVGIFYPDGKNTQRDGLRIDIEVKPTISGIRAKRDEVLERAIELVNTF